MGQPPLDQLKTSGWPFRAPGPLTALAFAVCLFPNKVKTAYNFIWDSNYLMEMIQMCQTLHNVLKSYVRDMLPAPRPSAARLNLTFNGQAKEGSTD